MVPRNVIRNISVNDDPSSLLEQNSQSNDVLRTTMNYAIADKSLQLILYLILLLRQIATLVGPEEHLLLVLCLNLISTLQINQELGVRLLDILLDRFKIQHSSHLNKNCRVESADCPEVDLIIICYNLMAVCTHDGCRRCWSGPGLLPSIHGSLL